MLAFLAHGLRARSRAMSPQARERVLNTDRVWGSDKLEIAEKIRASAAWLRQDSKKADKRLNKGDEVEPRGSPRSVQIPLLRHPPVPKRPTPRVPKSPRQQATACRAMKQPTLPETEEDAQQARVLMLLQTILLVTWGQWGMLTAAEQMLFETRFRDYSTHRRAALKAGGLLQPLEALLWMNPLVCHRAAELQLHQQCHTSPTAWKSTLFQGCCEASSDRDPAGLSLGGLRLRDAPLRRMADLGGPFLTGVHTAHPESPFGASQAASVGFACLRDIEIATAVQPHRATTDLRSPRERRRTACAALEGCAHEASLIENTAASASHRTDMSRTMPTLVPKEARGHKAELLDYFDNLVELVWEPASGISRRPCTQPHGSEARTSPRAGARGASKPTSAPVMPDRGASMPRPPQTAEDVRRLARAIDGEQSLLAQQLLSGLDSHLGMNFGWQSGSRKTPMTSEEIRRTRAIERRSPCSSRGTRPKM
mmetsp:Transcript_35405/g.79868  ORF Transcript_35405/g.79868 Transcript_35405/m.79868 type:complete len:482 (-) Transcript_35405:8-1453(-)